MKSTGLCALAAVAVLGASAAHGTDAGTGPNRDDCGAAESCVKQAVAFRQGDGVKKDLRRACELYETACDKGHSLSCADLATLLAVGGASIGRDERRAVTLFDKSCTLGFANACFSAGNMYLQGSREPGVLPRDYKRAGDYYRRGCDAGEGVACASLADLYRKGLGLPRDSKRAKALGKRAKDLGSEGE
jgi:TPR repeat protein